MAEMAEACDYSRSPPTPQNKTLRAWRTLLSWVALLFHILVQIIRGTPSWAQVLSYVRYRKRLLFSSDPARGSSAASVEFRPLPAEIPPGEVESELSVLPRPSPPPLCPSVVCDGRVLEKLTEVDGKPKVNHVTVFERPGLHDFLRQLSEFADLILFTAGLEGYASPLVDKIDIENKFCRRLYRPATTTTEYREHVKDLSCISNNFCRIVIVDNNPFSFLLQPLNGIPCIPFYAGQPNDEQLLGIVLPLLKHLSYQKDVRPVLYERFHMPEWFEKHGIPVSNWITSHSPRGT